ncbi:BEACH domain-containing protein C2 [Selaginella moellendorffii]|uniref:BEACH domain-containing protein C2 n=1 Tax=Selaginella moellendorffii TaxID=88036 RepID=UPI000D1CEDAF|nr:BEACH domain-containing protein C2 [Selaginella moellendorffii]|eukprot:XP_024526779.1 BEACH domain-containing protein C2 [Selaginella moellendorffii]
MEGRDPSGDLDFRDAGDDVDRGASYLEHSDGSKLERNPAAVELRARSGDGGHAEELPGEDFDNVNLFDRSGGIVEGKIDGNGFHDLVMSSRREDGGGEIEEVDESTAGNSPGSSSVVKLEDQFDEVSLNDNVGTPSGFSSARDSVSSITVLNSGNASPKSSSLGSPLHSRGKAVLPDASPELMRLIDSAIQGADADQKSLHKLKRVVAGEESIEGGDGKVDNDTRARLVVEILLAKMGGIEALDDTAAPKMMLSAGAAIVAGELIPWLSSEGDTGIFVSPRTRIAKGITMTLQACTRNRAMCSAAGLLRVLLEAARILFARKAAAEEQGHEWDASPLLDAIQALGSHCLTVVDLRHWLFTVTETGQSLDLVLALEKTMAGEETRGPAYTFEFDGESSGLLGPGDSKWPFGNGYAFATWLYIESFADTLNTATTAAAIAVAAAAKTGKSSAMSAAAAASALAGEGTAHMPRLFSFLSADNQGVEAYFHGQFLVVESAVAKGKKSSLHFTYAFKPRRWYFVGLEHIFKQSLIGKGDSEVKLYVDGRLYEARPFDFPRVSKPLAFCCIGTNPPPAMAGLQRRRRQCPLFAEVGPIYIFKEPIGQDKMNRLAARGGDVVPTFGNGAGLPWLAISEESRALAEESVALDIEIGPKIHLLYHPQLLIGRSCIDISPAGSSGLHRRPAEVLGHVHVASRVKPMEAVWAMGEGGPLALLPLVVGSVNKETLQPNAGDITLSVRSSFLSGPILRILATALKYPGNADEMTRGHAPELLAHLLGHLLVISSISKSVDGQERDEELVAAVVSLCQAPKGNATLEVQLYSSLLLDLKLWSRCSYGLQKKLLSSLADMVFTEEKTMRAANAVQMLLDGCRSCYWIVPEPHSVHSFAGGKNTRPLGEINALVDELLVIVELLTGSAQGPIAASDVRCLVQFVLDCPQPNQVARVLHLLYRLVVQPNAARAATFADLLMKNGVVEMLLTLIQRESEIGENSEGLNLRELDEEEEGEEFEEVPEGDITRTSSDSEAPVLSQKPVGHKNVGGITLSISADAARNNFRNVDKGDGMMLGIVGLLGALLVGGHLKSTIGNTVAGSGAVESPGLASWLLYALQRAFQVAPKRLLTRNVYSAVLSVVVRSEGGMSSTDDGLAIFDTVHRFEHRQLFLSLLRALPSAPREIQLRALQDILLLACTHADNRTRLTAMPEWPEWLLEILIANYEVGLRQLQEGLTSFQDLEELIYSFLTIILEHSMRSKDGWMDIEAAIHCAEWLAIFGGPSMGEQRLRREESLPVIKRRLLGNLLDFAGRELQKQTHAVAAAAAGVAAGGLSPRAAKVEAEAAAHLSMSLAENSLVLLMLVEDHLRLQHQAFNSGISTGSLSVGSMSPRGQNVSSFMSFGRSSFDGGENLGSRRYSSGSDSGLPIEAFTSMADSNGQVSVSAIERLTASAAAEPYESVRCAFASYGSCGVELAEGWKSRSRMWYGVGLPSKGTCGGGGGGWESWSSALEKDANGEWVDFELVKKCIVMLKSLLLDDSGPGGSGGVGFGGGAGTGAGGVHALNQLLDSDQPFYAMLRMVLLSMREEYTEEVQEESSYEQNFETHGSSVRTRSALLWCVISPFLTMPLSEARRQRVLVAACIFYSEVWHAVSADRKILRRQYVEAILPPFTALLRRWRPMLSGVHELTDADGLSPLTVEDRPLATDVVPSEAALAMISPSWAAAFASPPVSMALAMAAAGVGGGEASAPKGFHVKREVANVERKFLRFRTFSGFQKSAPAEPPVIASPEPKDKAGAKAAASAAARDQERAAKIGSGRGLGAVAMATSSQRRSSTDRERVQRWNLLDAMSAAWQEFFSLGGESGQTKELKNKTLASLSAIVLTTKRLRSLEVERRLTVIASDAFRLGIGLRAWRSLLRRLLEIEALFGPLLSQLNCPRTFWKLDPVENSLRMRKRLKINYKGSDHHGAAADYREPEETRTRDSAPLPDSLLTAGAPALVPETTDEGTEDDLARSDVDDVDFKRENHSPSKQHEYEQMAASTDFPLASPGHSIPVTPQSKERLLLEVSAVLVQPLKTGKGMFQVTTSHIYFVTDWNQDIVDSCSLPGGTKVWHISSLKEVHSRRYLLRKSALELFMLDMSNHFFDFESADQKSQVYRALVQARPPHLNTIYAATQRPERLLKRTQLMEQWANRQISNFEYLMRLNTLAGRTYNDITQYPVFPWILSDYTSKKLNLDDPNVYRDLSKPVGALNPSRLEKIMERYHSFDDPVIPKFHYGSHYSSSGTVLYYLTRIEPFATLAIQLQGGKFDHADRMFSDIGSTWNGVLEDMSDVKELVPELFYMPEILTNDGGFDLGRTQLGEQIGNVKLPPWAGSPIDFVQKHRTALESEYVSAHLHEWIDLIFGYKQRGRDAVAAQNVFFYMTYEGSVDVDKITDPAIRKATQDQIAYFGQTPSQLLTIPHIKRLPLHDVLHLQTIFRNPSSTVSYSIPSPERCNVPAAKLLAASDSIVTVDLNVPACHVAMHRWQPNTPDGQGSPFLFQHSKSAAGSNGGSLMRMFRGQPVVGTEESHFPRVIALQAHGIRSDAAVAISSNGRLLFTGGHADNSLKVVATNNARVIESAVGHSRPITCVGLSPDGRTMVTGSQDATAIIWRVHSNSFASTSGSSDPSTMASGDLGTVDMKKRRVEGPLCVLRGHVDELSVCCIDGSQDIVVSASPGRGVLLHSVAKGRFIRRLDIDRADILALSTEGIVVVWDRGSSRLQTVTLNGIQVATRGFEGDVSSIVTSSDGRHIIVGFTSKKLHEQQGFELHHRPRVPDDEVPDLTPKALPSISLLDIYTLQVIHTLRLQDGEDVTAMALNRDNTNLVASTANGQLLVFTDPALSIRVVDQMLRLGWEGSSFSTL